MNTAHILSIRNRIAAAAADLAKCDTEALRDIALEILSTVSRRSDSEDPSLVPSPVQRAILCQVAQILIGDGAFGRSTWRLQAAQTALQSIERLTSGECS